MVIIASKDFEMELKIGFTLRNGILSFLMECQKIIQGWPE